MSSEGVIDCANNQILDAPFCTTCRVALSAMLTKLALEALAVNKQVVAFLVTPVKPWLKKLKVLRLYEGVSYPTNLVPTCI